MRIPSPDVLRKILGYRSHPSRPVRAFIRGVDWRYETALRECPKLGTLGSDPESRLPTQDDVRDYAKSKLSQMPIGTHAKLSRSLGMLTPNFARFLSGHRGLSYSRVYQLLELLHDLEDK